MAVAITAGALLSTFAALLAPSVASASTSKPTAGATGYLEVCKNAGDPYVKGSFIFHITDGSYSHTQSVPVGQCTGDLLVPAGNATITEVQTPPYVLEAVTTLPTTALVSSNIPAGEAVVSVASGPKASATTAFFVNRTETGYVKACKTLAANTTAVVGSTFTFDVSAAGYPTQTVSVTTTGVGPSFTQCSIAPVPLPLGTHVTVTEVGSPTGNLQATSVEVTPPQQQVSVDTGNQYQNNGTPFSEATADLIVGPNVTAATFTNEALGWVEVCKYATDPSAQNQALSYYFSVNRGMYHTWVHASHCSQPFEVPAGTATVTEAAKTNFELEKVNTVSSTDPTGSRLQKIVTTCTPSLPCIDGGTAYVTVPWSGVGDETVVNFWNGVVPGQVKICVQQTSRDANLYGFKFTYTVSATFWGTTHTATVALKVPLTDPPAANCTQLSEFIPVVDQHDVPVNIQITQEAPPVSADIETDSILYQGNGTNVVTTPAVLPATGATSLSYDLGAGINASTWINGRTP